MIFGEYIKEDGTFTVDNLWFIQEEYLKLPLYIQKDEYICKGNGMEIWSPSFTYHGFRYALVFGITPNQATEELHNILIKSQEFQFRFLYQAPQILQDRQESPD